MLHLKHCSIEWTSFGARTVFPDGLECSAWPHPEQTDYLILADRLGYDGDALAFCREHDLAHHLIEEWMHDRPSRVIRAVAEGKPLPWSEAIYEELAAQMLQGLVRANKRPIAGGYDWHGLKARFSGYVAQLDTGLSAYVLGGLMRAPRLGSTGPRPGY